MGGECGMEWPMLALPVKQLTSPLIIPAYDLSPQFAVGMWSPYHIWIPDTGTAENIQAAYPASHIHSTSLFLIYHYLHPPTELQPCTNCLKQRTLTGKHQISAHFPSTFLARKAEWAQMWSRKDRDGHWSEKGRER
jgi:hypothetical protein